MTVVAKAGFYFLIFISILLFALIIFSKTGCLDYRKLKQVKNNIQNQINDVDSKNQKLEKEIISLKTDMDYIKHLAKHEHDMAEEDELIFKNKPAKKEDIQ